MSTRFRSKSWRNALLVGVAAALFSLAAAIPVLAQRDSGQGPAAVPGPAADAEPTVGAEPPAGVEPAAAAERSAAAEAEERAAAAALSDAGVIDPVIEGYLDQLGYWLRLFAGENVPCGTPCVRNEDPRSGLIQQASWCRKVGFDEQLAAGGFKGQSRAALEQSARACEVIYDAQDELGTADIARLRAIAGSALGQLPPEAGRR